MPIASLFRRRYFFLDLLFKNVVGNHISFRREVLLMDLLTIIAILTLIVNILILIIDIRKSE